MIFAFILLALASLLGSGVLFKHQRITTFVATAAALWEGQWLLITLLHRTAFSSLDTTLFYSITSVALLLFWSILFRRWQFKWRLSAISLFKELVVLLTVLVVALAAYTISARNGWNGEGWTFHGFYNGDTATFISLVEASFNTNTLVATNPFAAGAPLEYPTLLHASIATLVRGFGLGTEWLMLLPVFAYLQIFITIPLFFLLWDLVAPEPTELWQRWLGVKSRALFILAQAGLVLLVLMLAWDNYVYPQSHFFLIALFLLEASVFISARKLQARQQILPVVVGTAIAIVLMAANAVTGAAATALAAVLFALRVDDRSRTIFERLLFAIGIPVLAVAFLTITPGNGAFGLPQFSYIAAIDMLRLAPFVIALAIAVFTQLSSHRFATSAVAACFGLAFLSFFFSTRNIVIENASRFFYHALLIGFPLLAFPLIQGITWLRRELIHTAHTWFELLIGWATAGALVLVFLLPALSSVASAHDNLMFKDEQVIDTASYGAMLWLKFNAPTSSVVIASPDEPWIVPIFAGRSMLRADYWLSPDDMTLNDLRQAFAGSKSAQESVAAKGDYLVLRDTEKVAWEPIGLKPIYANTSIFIYSLK